jgi:hypothetical protein
MAYQHAPGSPSDHFVLEGGAWDALADGVERAEKLTVAAPLQISNTPSGKVISFSGTEGVILCQIEGDASGGGKYTGYTAGTLPSLWAATGAIELGPSSNTFNGVGRAALIINLDEVDWSTHILSRVSGVGRRFLVGMFGGWTPDNKVVVLVNGGTGGEFPVTLSSPSGSAGDQTTRTAFTYTVTGPGGTTLGTGVAMTGNGQRLMKMTMTAGTRGRATYEPDGTLKLLWADEIASTQQNCS